MGSIIPEVDDDRIVMYNFKLFLVKEYKGVYRIYRTREEDGEKKIIPNDNTSRPKDIKSPEKMKNQNIQFRIQNQELYEEFIGLQLLEQI